jgi:hypothetical protein
MDWESTDESLPGEPPYSVKSLELSSHFSAQPALRKIEFQAKATLVLSLPTRV